MTEIVHFLKTVILLCSSWLICFAECVACFPPSSWCWWP